MNRLPAVAVLLGVLVALEVAAEEQRLVLDPERTQITFDLGATLHRVEGSARLERGVIDFDLDTGTASGRVVVDATSLETGNAKRDRAMHSKVLRSEEYASIVFVPLSVGRVGVGADAGDLDLRGSIAIHGEERPLTIRVQLLDTGSSFRARGIFQVPYVAWGMRNPSRLLLRVAKTVNVEIVGAGTLVAAGAG